MNGYRQNRIGTPLHIEDKNGEPLHIGDTVIYYSQYGTYQGVLFYNPAGNWYGIALDYSMWYGDDKYNLDSYGKFVGIPMDNGGKMHMEKIG